ncbi:MAG: Uncharacterized protein G01um101466_577 [Parcubacteria group bacterium Gr01-1014_66]|nr:MAG: Uncharacterized protein G01um101466_577 [Parcubacteria group bacterium Gr01-1014_66]
MIQEIFKRVGVWGIGLVLCMSVFSPAVAFAQEESDNSVTQSRPLDRLRERVQQRGSAANPAGSTNFCSRITAWENRLVQKAGEQGTKLDTRRMERKDTLAEKRNRRNEEHQDHRERWDENRDAHYEKLEERAITDVQKQAVAAFRAAVERAVAARRLAVDTARKAFRDAVDRALAKRKSSADAAIAALKNTTQIAIDKAKADCAAGTTPAIVHDTTEAAIKAARAQFSQDRQAVEKIGPQVEAFAKTRKDAIEKALRDFEAIVEQARDTLKAAFNTRQTPPATH